MKRTYLISSSGCPTDTLYGDFSVGPFNAAVNYAGLYLAGYEVIPEGCIQCPDMIDDVVYSVWRFEAINHDTQMGALMWVRERA